MRILFAAPFGACRKQTLPRRMLPLARGLATEHVVEVLAPAWDCPDEAGRVTSDQGVTVRAPALGPAPDTLLDPLLLRRLMRAAVAFDPDVVHVFKGLGYAGWVADWLRRRAGVPIVLDMDDLETAAGWGGQRRWPVSWYAARQERTLLRKAVGVTVASASLQAHASATRGSATGILYLPNGLDLAPRPTDAAANPPVALLYTRGNDVDAERVRRLWLGILRQAPEAWLWVVGDWRQAPDLPRCEQLGWLEGRALVDALRGAAVALFPLKDSPTTRAKSPARLLDCLAQGLPVVVDEVGEYGTLAGAGSVVAPGDDGAFVAAAARLLRSPQARSAAGAAAWQAAQHHCWNERVRDLAVFYRQVVTSPSGR